MSKPAGKRVRQPKEFDVEAIRAMRTNTATNETHYRIKWTDFDESHTSWELAKDVHAPEMQQAIEQHHKQADAHWKWEYFLADSIDGKPIGWHPYDSHAGYQMDRFFSQYCKDVSSMADKVECVGSGKYHYEIDFDQMTQTNIRVHARTSRPIRGTPS